MDSPRNLRPRPRPLFNRHYDPPTVSPPGQCQQPPSSGTRLQNARPRATPAAKMRRTKVKEGQITTSSPAIDPGELTDNEDDPPPIADGLSRCGSSSTLVPFPTSRGTTPSYMSMADREGLEHLPSLSAISDVGGPLGDIDEEEDDAVIRAAAPPGSLAMLSGDNDISLTEISIDGWDDDPTESMVLSTPAPTRIHNDGYESSSTIADLSMPIEDTDTDSDEDANGDGDMDVEYWEDHYVEDEDEQDNFEKEQLAKLCHQRTNQTDLSPEADMDKVTQAHAREVQPSGEEPMAEMGDEATVASVHDSIERALKAVSPDKLPHVVRPVRQLYAALPKTPHKDRHRRGGA